MSLHIVQINEGVSSFISLSFSCSNEFPSFRLSQARESNCWLCKNCLLTCFGVFFDNFVVERIYDSALISIPKQVFMNTTETIISIHDIWLNYSTFRRISKQRFLFNLDFKCLFVLNSNKVIEAELFLFDFCLIVNLETIWIFNVWTGCSQSLQRMVQLLSGFKRSYDERELCKFWLLLFLHSHPHSFQSCWLMHDISVYWGFLSLLIFYFWQKVCLCVTMELPDVYTILISSADDCVIVTRIKHEIRNGEGVANECLVEEGNRLLRFIVPNFDQIIFTASKHKTSIQTKISCVYWAPMNSSKLSKENSFKSS